MWLSHHWVGSFVLTLLLKPTETFGEFYFRGAQVPCAPDGSVHLISLGLQRVVADTVSQGGNTIEAPASSGSRVCFLCLSLKDAVSPRCSQVGACCSFDLFGSEPSHPLNPRDCLIRSMVPLLVTLIFCQEQLFRMIQPKLSLNSVSLSFSCPQASLVFC